MIGGRRVGRACAAALLALGVAACGSDTGSDTDSDTDSGRDESDRAAGLTTPGTELELGRSAVVPLNDEAGVIELTVSSIERGTTDVDRLGGTAYYVRLGAAVASGDGHQFFAEQYLTAWAGGERIGPIAAPVSVGPCTRAYFELDPPVGTSIQPCLTFVVPEGGGAIDRVAFYGDDYRIDDDTLVTWGS